MPLKSNDAKSVPRVVDENHKSPSATSVTEPSKGMPTPPKQQKVKSGPPPRLQVPQSILNKTEGIVPTNPEPQVKAGKDIQALLREEMLKPSKKRSTTSANAKSKQSKAEVAQNIAPSDHAEKKLKAASSEHKIQSVLKGASGTQKSSSVTPPKQPKIPSGKPPLIAQFRDVKFDKDSSDDDSDSSNVSSGSDSGSGSEDDSDEGEDGENEEDSSGSDTDTDGSDEEEEGGEQHDDDEDEEDDDDVAMDTQESGASFEDSSSHKRKADQSSSGIVFFISFFPFFSYFFLLYCKINYYFKNVFRH